MRGCRAAGTLRSMQTDPIHPAVRVGHVHLRVADLDRSLAFYRDALGFGVTADGRDVGRAVQRLLDHGVAVDHGTDHGGTVSVYLTDPDGNGVELYHDRPRQDWFDADGRPVLRADRFDPRDLLTSPTEGSPPCTHSSSRAARHPRS